MNSSSRWPRTACRSIVAVRARGAPPRVEDPTSNAEGLGLQQLLECYEEAETNFANAAVLMLHHVQCFQLQPWPRRCAATAPTVCTEIMLRTSVAGRSSSDQTMTEDRHQART